MDDLDLYTEDLDPTEFLMPYHDRPFADREALIDALFVEQQPPPPASAPRELFADLVKLAAQEGWLLEADGVCAVVLPPELRF